MEKKILIIISHWSICFQAEVIITHKYHGIKHFFFRMFLITEALTKKFFVSLSPCDSTGSGVVVVEVIRVVVEVAGILSVTFSEKFSLTFSITLVVLWSATL